MESIYSRTRDTYNAFSRLGLEYNVKVTELQNDLGDLESEVASLSEDVEKYEEATRTLIGVERDIQHVREILKRIEELIVQ